MRYLLHRLPYRNKGAAVIGNVDPLLVGRASLVGGAARGGVHAGQRGLRALLHRGPHVHGGPG